MKPTRIKTVLPDVIAGRPWRLLAACRFANPDLFFPISASGRSLDQVEQAKAICAVCQVSRECLSFALATNQVYGVWGGKTEQERRSMKKQPPEGPCIIPA